MSRTEEERQNERANRWPVPVGTKERFQWVWFSPEWYYWPWVAFCTFPKSNFRFIYRWVLILGPIEIRRWETRTMDKVREAEGAGP